MIRTSAYLRSYKLANCKIEHAILTYFYNYSKFEKEVNNCRSTTAQKSFHGTSPFVQKIKARVESSGPVPLLACIGTCLPANYADVPCPLPHLRPAVKGDLLCTLQCILISEKDYFFILFFCKFFFETIYFFRIIRFGKISSLLSLT